MFCGSYGVRVFLVVLRVGDLGCEILVWAALRGCLGCGLRGSEGPPALADASRGYSRALRGLFAAYDVRANDRPETNQAAEKAFFGGQK